MLYNLPTIRYRLIEHFSLNELRDIYFDLGVDWENVVGNETKSDKSRELLTYLKRRSRVPELIKYCQKERPNTEWNLIKTPKDQRDDFVQKIGLTPAISNKYLETKFELYRAVWQSLHELKEAGNILWERASKENILNFASLLNQARSIVEINAILFDEQEHKDLLKILDGFGKFNVGKSRLLDIRSERDEYAIFPWNIEHQIEQNGKIREDYEALLILICDKFRNRLSSWATN